jgi:DNA topoisomerase IA
MHGVSPRGRGAGSELIHTIAEASEQSFGSTGSVLSSIARMLWPHKTAANIAAATNCSVRAAEMYLAGDRDWSGDAIAAIVAEILSRHKMRNVKIRPR